MTKAILNRFLIERIHKDWIYRLYPSGYKVEKPKDKGVRKRG